MARVKRAVNAHKKRRATLERGQRLPRPALAAVPQGQGAGHPLARLRLPRPQGRKGDFRRLWIQRINAAARANGMTYNRLIQGLKAAGVEVDRRMLAELAVNDAGGVRRARRDRPRGAPARRHAPAAA